MICCDQSKDTINHKILPSTLIPVGILVDPMVSPSKSLSLLMTCKIILSTSDNSPDAPVRLMSWVNLLRICILYNEHIEIFVNHV